MIEYLVIVSTLILGLAGLQAYAQRFYLLDYRRIGGLLAARLLDRFEDAVDMDEEAVKNYLRDRYLEMCATFGLPEKAIDSVVGHGYMYIQKRSSPVTIYE